VQEIESMRDETELFGRVEKFVGALAQCRVLGIRAVSARDNELVLELPYQEAIIGNLDQGVIHGGAITTLMDTTAGSGVLCALPEFELCPTLDLRVDYMRAAKPGLSVFARASCFRMTPNILFMRCEAYQVDRTVAHCVATFMRMGSKGLKSLSQMPALPQVSVPDVEVPKDCGGFKALVEEVRRSKDYARLIRYIPYAGFIGVGIVEEAGVRRFMLQQRDSNIGNPILPSIHGGVIGGFMELSAGLHLMLEQPALRYPKIVDFSLDYLRSGKNTATFAQCRVTRQGSRVANVEIEAWQSSRDAPIALARAHFLLEE
jgi:uncharacterized protein (TIGR00369 family)